MNSHDIIIVGGGLAGCALAKNMAERGYRVLVLERETRFRDRVRGEQMHPSGVAEARALGIYDGLIAAGGNQTRWWVTYQGKSLLSKRDLAETCPHGVGSFNCYHPTMQDVALRLAVEAGAEVHRGVTVDGVTPGSEPAVRFREGGQERVLRARLIVGADGRASKVRSWAGFTVDRVADCLAITGALLERTPMPDDSVFTVRGADAYVLIAPQGGQRARAYFMTPKSNVARHRGERGWEESFRLACLSTGAPAEWFDGATLNGPVAQFDGADHWVEHPARDSVVLIGDAAAASDPSYGCGLSLALTDARRLRDCLLSSSDWNAAIDEYARARSKYYGTVRRVTQWFSELRWSPGAAADERRARVFARLIAEPSLVPDLLGLGPEAPSDQATRRFLLER